jgi:hypothetical protein
MSLPFASILQHGPNVAIATLQPTAVKYKYLTVTMDQGSRDQDAAQSAFLDTWIMYMFEISTNSKGLHENDVLKSS